MTHVERIKSGSGYTYIDLQRCCRDPKCFKVLVDGKAVDRREIEHALKCLFGEASPYTRWSDKNLPHD